MKLSVAQIRSIAGDIPANLAKHVDAIHRAAELGAEVILFPELSLTGYEPTLAGQLAARADDSRFDGLQSLSDSHQIVICAGMPLKVERGIEIGMLLFQPDSPRQTYSKQLLHADELPYFVSGTSQVLLRKGEHTLAPAICFESLQPQHAQAAANLGANLYLASVAKSASGVTRAYNHFPLIARQHNMIVAMSNCLGPSDNFLGVGRSAIWNSQGELLGQLDDQHDGVLVVDTLTTKCTLAFLG
jgi:predicted amidohydrolase